MSTIVRNRLRFERNFTQIPNAWMRDDRLSFGARGILAHLMTHDERWETSVAALVRNGPQGKAAVNALIKELEDAGYLVREQGRSGGRFESSKYLITDPFEEIVANDPPFTDFRSTVNPSTVNSTTGNRPPKKTNNQKTNLSEEKLGEEGGETTVGTSPAADPEDRTTPYEDLGGGLGKPQPTAPPRRDRCDFHRGAEHPPPCRGCKEARERAIDEDREKMRREIFRQQELAAAALEGRFALIDACDLCDEDGYRNGYLCDHDPARPEKVARGAALLRQALRGGLDG